MSTAPDGPQSMSAASLLEVFDVNVGATQRVTSALLPALRRSQQKKLIMMYATNCVEEEEQDLGC